MAYRVELAPAAQRELGRLPDAVRERLRAPILALASDPRPAGVRKLRGEERTWRIRVGDFRVIYDVYDDENVIVVLKVGRRNERTYRR